MVSKLFKNKFLLALLFLVGNIVAQQGPILEWVRPIGGNGNEEGRSIKVDAKGNVYTCGYFDVTIDFDPGPGTYTMNSAGGWDGFISKLDSSGNFVWAVRFGGINDDKCLSIELDTAGNIYTTGLFMNTADFDPGPGTNTLTSLGGWDIFIWKLNSSGNLIWVKQFGGPQDQHANAVKLDRAGNIYFTGNFLGVSDFDPGPGTYTVTPPIIGDAFICKLDFSGNFVMVKQIETSFNAAGYSIVVDTLGNIHVSGSYYGTADFDPSPSIYSKTSNGSSYDMFVWKLDPLGNFLWVATAGGGSVYEDSGTSIGLDPKGNVYTAGYFRGTADFDPGSAVFNLTSSGNACADAFVLKLRSTGQFVWVKGMGGGSIDEALGIKVDSIGNSYITGFMGTSAQFGNYAAYGTGGQNIFITKLDSMGVNQWAKAMSSGYGNSIDVDVNGKIYTTGWYTGTTDFDPNIGTSSSTSMSFTSWDFFIHKMGLCTIPGSPVNTTQSITANVCAGTSATLSATGTGSVAWFNGFQTFLGFGNNFVTSNFMAPGYYTYYADAFTCIQSGTMIMVSFTVNPGPTILASTTATNLCIGQSATITASGASTYTWNTSSTNTAIVVSPTTTTSYTITGTGANGCVDSTSFTQSVSACTEINESGTDYELNLYPNPTSGVISIKAKSGLEICIYNILGEATLNTEFKTDVIELDLSNYAKGIYFVKIGSVTKKILKE